MQIDSGRVNPDTAGLTLVHQNNAGLQQFFSETPDCPFWNRFGDFVKYTGRDHHYDEALGLSWKFEYIIDGPCIQKSFVLKQNHRSLVIQLIPREHTTEEVHVTFTIHCSHDDMLSLAILYKDKIFNQSIYKRFF